MGDIVLLNDPDGPVVQIQLNRPEKKNAVNIQMLDALRVRAESLEDMADVRCVVMSGAGGSFSAGLDTAIFLEFAKDIEALKIEITNPPDGRVANRFQAPVLCWQELPVPVIAAIEGVCFGAGMQLALAADFRIAAPTAKLSIMEGKWGLIPDMGITQSLPNLMRMDQAKELIMTARILDAHEALSLGLITRIENDPMGAALELANEIAERSPDAIRATKALLNTGWNASRRDALALEAALQAEIIGGHNQIEAVMANIQKRAPKFS